MPFSYRLRHPKVEEFYRPISGKIRFSLEKTIEKYTFEAVAKVAGNVPSVEIQGSMIWVKAKDEVYLRIPFRKGKFNNYYMHLYEVLRGNRGRIAGWQRIIAMPFLPHEVFMEYRKNLLTNIDNLVDCVEKSYGT